MAEKEEDIKYNGSVYAKKKVMDFEEFHKQSTEGNGKRIDADEKTPIFGTKRIIGNHQFASFSTYFFKAIDLEVKDDDLSKGGEEEDDIKKQTEIPGVTPLPVG